MKFSSFLFELQNQTLKKILSSARKNSATEIGSTDVEPRPMMELKGLFSGSFQASP
jgi:hypothetical protein